MLQVRNVTKRFGGIVAVNDLTFSMEHETILGLIGPNGAGKTTMLNVITGLEKPDQGEIWYKGKRISGIAPHRIAQMGLVRTYQITRVFKDMSTLENLYVPMVWQRRKLTSPETRARELLESFNLWRLKDERAGNLSGGQQKVLELLQALMMKPETVVLDEPFYGIHPTLKKKFTDYLKMLNKEAGLSILIISHDIPTIMDICEKIVVMSCGTLIAEGPPDLIRNDQKVIEAYLGA
jgi:ABC-type branched-subunit amino acid transport system ATPase component